MSKEFKMITIHKNLALVQQKLYKNRKNNINEKELIPGDT